ncbi:MAG: serine/threonine protein kinase, partial [Planctomycetota bacterium]
MSDEHEDQTQDTHAGDEADSVLEELCAERPDLAERLTLAVDVLRNAGDRLGAGSSHWPSIPGFLAVRMLGEGGMGVVWLARQLKPARSVALKLVKVGLLRDETGAEGRFQREIESVARLSHSGIAALYEAGEHEGIAWFSQEYVPGASLADVLRSLAGSSPEELTGGRLRATPQDLAGASRQGQVSSQDTSRGSWVRSCLHLVAQVALALHHAHERGVVHRDIKPGNILLSPEGRAVLIDFGLARLTDEDSMTRSGAVLGSLPYMSPQAVRGDAALDGRADVYSLGVTLFELLTLRRPFTGQTIEATRTAILDGRPRSAKLLNPALSPEVIAVCLCAIDPDPNRRYASAQAFHDDLIAVLEDRAPQARPPGRLVRIQRWCRRHPARAVAWTLGVPLLVGTPTVITLQSLDAARKERELTIEAHQAWLLSEAHFARAAETIDRVLRETAAIELRDIPGVAKARLKMVESAMSLYEELVAERPADDPVLRRLRARLLDTRARTMSEVGITDDLVNAYSEVAALMAELRLEGDPEFEWITKRSVVLHNRALAQTALGMHAEARADYQAARSGFEEARAEGAPVREEVVLQLLANLAANLNELGESEQARAILESVAGISAELISSDEIESETFEAASRSLYLLGSMHLQAGRWDPALEVTRRGLEFSMHRLELEPHSVEAIRAVSSAELQLGLILLRRQQIDEATQVLTRVCQRLDDLYAIEPLSEIASLRLSGRGRLAFALGHAGESERARELMQDVVSERLELMQG